MSGWQTEEDIRRDLFEYSNMDYVGDDTFTPAPPKSIAEYKARTSKVKNPGLFDDDIDPDVTVFISGRGRFHPNRIITPGQPVQLFPEDDIEIQKKIREVSGLGFSNEIIEREFGRYSDNECNNENDDLINPDVKLSVVSEYASAASTSRLSPVFQKLTVREDTFLDIEGYSQTESSDLPKQPKKSNINMEKFKLTSANTDDNDFLSTEKMKLRDHYKCEKRSNNNSVKISNLELENKLDSMVETESQTTEESSQAESVKSTTINKKSKKKKKFKNFFANNPSNIVDGVANNAPSTWLPPQYGASNIKKEDFPALK